MISLKKSLKASLTVEASFIIGMTIIVIGIMLSLWIYKYQECWYTQAMSECLLTGSNQGILDEENCQYITEEKWDDVASGNYLVPKELSAQIDCSEDKICMNIDGRTLLGKNRLLQIEIEQEIRIVRPVQFIRKASAVKGAIGN